MEWTPHSSRRLIRLDWQKPRSRESLEHFLRREKRVGGAGALVGVCREDGGRPTSQTLLIQELCKDIRVFTRMGSKLVSVRIHDRISVVVWAELPGAGASRRSSSVKGTAVFGGSRRTREP